MLVVLGVAGFVMLIAIIWCIRMMRRGFTPLSANKERWRERFKEEEIRLHKEESDIPAQEQLHLLLAAVKDLLRLDENHEAQVRLDGDRVRVETTQATWLLSYHVREQKLQSMHKVLHGPSHWVLEKIGPEHVLTPENAHAEEPLSPSYGSQSLSREEFGNIGDLMRAFQAKLSGEEEIPDLHFLPRRKSRFS